MFKMLSQCIRPVFVLSILVELSHTSPSPLLVYALTMKLYVVKGCRLEMTMVSVVVSLTMESSTLPIF